MSVFNVYLKSGAVVSFEAASAQGAARRYVESGGIERIIKIREVKP